MSTKRMLQKLDLMTWLGHCWIKSRMVATCCVQQALSQEKRRQTRNYAIWHKLLQKPDGYAMRFGQCQEMYQSSTKHFSIFWLFNIFSSIMPKQSKTCTKGCWTSSSCVPAHCCHRCSAPASSAGNPAAGGKWRSCLPSRRTFLGWQLLGGSGFIA